MGWHPLELFGPKFALSTMLFKEASCRMDTNTTVKKLLRKQRETHIGTIRRLTREGTIEKALAGWFAPYTFISLSASSTAPPPHLRPGPVDPMCLLFKSPQCFCQGRNQASKMGSGGGELGWLSLPFVICKFREVMHAPLTVCWR